MKNLYIKSIAPLLILLALVLVLAGKNPADGPPKSEKEPNFLEVEQAVQKSDSDGKTVMILIYEPSCGKCRNMELLTLKDPKIAEQTERAFHLVKLNAQSEETIVYKGKKMTIKDLARKNFGVSVFPSLVFLHASRPAAVVPYYKNAEELSVYLDRFDG